MNWAGLSACEVETGKSCFVWVFCFVFFFPFLKWLVCRQVGRKDRCLDCEVLPYVESYIISPLPFLLGKKKLSAIVQSCMSSACSSHFPYSNQAQSRCYNGFTECLKTILASADFVKASSSASFFFFILFGPVYDSFQPSNNFFFFLSRKKKPQQLICKKQCFSFAHPEIKHIWHLFMYFIYWITLLLLSLILFYFFSCWPFFQVHFFSGNTNLRSVCQWAVLLLLQVCL